MPPKEGRVGPISKEELELVLNCSEKIIRTQFLDKLIGILNERQDGHFGIITNISQLIRSENEPMKRELGMRLAQEITRNPQRYVGRVLSTKIFPKLSNICPEFVVAALEPLINNPEPWFQMYNDEEDITKIQILILKFIRIAEEADGGRKCLISPETIQNLLKKAIDGCDDATKLDAITMALESRQTTRILTKELALFKIMFLGALGFQEQSHRQTFLALTSKLIYRIKDSLSRATRYRMYSQEQLDEIHRNYKCFLSWLIDTCFSNIYYNAYFGSFILTMSTLKTIVDVITFADDRFPIIESFKDKLCFDSILGCLTDSFEDNKQLALDLLIILCQNNLFDVGPHLSSLRQIAYELSESVNPASCLTAKYILKMVVQLEPKFNLKLNKTDCLYNNLLELVNLAEESIIVSKGNFIVGIANHPVYPRLTCIRALLEEINLIEVYKKFQNWKDLISKIIRLLVDASDSASAVVCNLNPETIGHLPMDLRPVAIDSLSKAFSVSVNLSDAKFQTITSQLLLISGWKTIKECSLSMGVMCNHLWWMYPNPGPGTLEKRTFQAAHEPLIDFDDMTRMISFFNHYLRNLRHRGAFEQAYNGFVMLTKRVWQEERYRKLLSDSLRSIMLEFKGESDSKESLEERERRIKSLKAYTTRRSAGLPFIVQAILVSENRHDSEIFRWVTNCLFSILDDHKAEHYQKVHCLNILKALINEHQLSEKVIPYVERTFIITIESFGSESFPIRNCANMLLSAVVGRTFGCSRLKNDVHRKNKLSFECFFSRYPLMLKIMLRYLKLGLEDRHYLASIHTIIILLNRLHPSLDPSDNYTYDKVIQPFIKPITSITLECPDLKLRKISAKLCVKLEFFCLNYHCCRSSLEPNDIPNLSSQTEISTNSPRNITRIPENRLHGLILIMNEWIKLEDLRSQCYYKDAIKNISKVTKQFIETIYRSFREVNTLSNYIMYELFNLIESYIIHVKLPNYRPSCAMWKLDLSSDTIFDITSKNPSLEEFTFRYFQIYIMFELEKGNPSYSAIENLFAKLLTRKPSREISANFHSALVRMIRLSVPNHHEVSETEFLLNNLNTDLITIHETIYDRLNNCSEYDKQSFKNYINTNLTRLELYNSEVIHKALFNFIDLYEFQTLHNKNQNQLFSSRVSNTPRAIEVLALMSILWDSVDFNKLKWCQDDDGSIEQKLVFLISFINHLPDCDVRFVALLCSAKLVNLVFKQNNKPRPIFDVLLRWSHLLDTVADGSSCLLSRQVSGRVLKSTLHHFLQTHEFTEILVNLLSALIKLMEDDESSVRLLASNSISKLNDAYQFKEDIGSKMEKFISVITQKIFNPDVDTDLKHCYNLMTRIIFIHSKGLQEVGIDDQERLFDKSKLNTYADYVAITTAARQGLCDFLERKSLPVSLTEIDLPISELIGSNLVFGGDSLKNNVDILKKSASLIALDLKRLIGTGYRRLLLDGGNPYFEFSIYKRIAFVSLMLYLTTNDTEVCGIKADLRESTMKAFQDCSTNLLKRCLNFLE